MAQDDLVRMENARFFRNLLFRLTRESSRFMSKRTANGYTAAEILGALERKATACDAGVSLSDALDVETREILRDLSGMTDDVSWGMSEVDEAVRYTCGQTAYGRFREDILGAANLGDTKQVALRQAERIAELEHPTPSFTKQKRWWDDPEKLREAREAERHRGAMRQRLVQIVQGLYEEYAQSWMFR